MRSCQSYQIHRRYNTAHPVRIRMCLAERLLNMCARMHQLTRRLACRARQGILTIDFAQGYRHSQRRCSGPLDLDNQVTYNGSKKGAHDG
jgi:hypothetical protein